MPEKDHTTRYWLILAVEIFLIVLATFMYKHVLLAALFALGMVSLIVFTITTIFEFKFLRIFSVVCGLAAALSGMVWFIPGVSPFEIGVSLTFCCSFYSLFILMAIFAIGRHVFISDRITSNKIIGSICLYFLIGIFFAFIFAAISIGDPGNFYLNGAPLDLKATGLRDFLYFSFSTLTTTGFGDFVPGAPVTRMLSYFESAIGAIYLAIVVARLVGMHVTQRKEESEGT